MAQRYDASSAAPPICSKQVGRKWGESGAQWGGSGAQWGHFARQVGRSGATSLGKRAGWGDTFWQVGRNGAMPPDRRGEVGPILLACLLGLFAPYGRKGTLGTSHACALKRQQVRPSPQAQTTIPRELFEVGIKSKTVA